MVHHESRVILDHGPGVSLFFFGDLQFGVKGFDETAWEEFKQEFKSIPNAYAIGLGDYGDFLRPTMQARMYSALSHDDGAKKQQDDMVRKSQDKILDHLGFLEGRLLGLHEGHHEWRFASGENTTQRICSALKATFLGWMSSTRLILESSSHTKNSHGSSFAYTIVSMHGTGNARFTSTQARWMENNIVPAWGADHYVMGHGCKSDAWEPFEFNEIRRRGEAGSEKRIRHCLAVGGFHDGYTNGWESSYVEKNGFLPQPRSWGVIRFRLSTSRKLHENMGTHGGGKCLDMEHLARFPKTPIKFLRGRE